MFCELKTEIEEIGCNNQRRYRKRKEVSIMGQIHNIEKLTDCKFLNLYHLNATSIHNTPVSYFVASRAKSINELKDKNR